MVPDKSGTIETALLRKLRRINYVWKNYKKMDLKRFKRYLKEKKAVLSLYEKIQLNKYRLATMISPELNTKMHYKAAFGKELDLDNPKTLNEKVLWLKLKKYMKDPLVIQCADKYRVRDYVKDCGCEDILINLIGVYERAEDINWEELPNQFVLKWNFGAGMNIVCTDKTRMNKDEVISQLKKWGKRKYWLDHSEMQYKYCPKRIVCEELIDTSNK